MKLHFIAIGGSAMHNLAIALKQKGYFITGSDDEIFDPAKSRLEKYGLLPKIIDWNEENINSDLDAIVLGMHAKKDNPELLKAQALGLKIYSYPEFLYEMSKEKIRIVIGGSHGKTSITAMILHALNHCGIETDYMVGAQLSGFEVMVKLTDNAKYMVLEGDEYLTSPIDLRPKFHLYNPNIALISGIAWDHINVFPTFDIYKEQFSIFCEKIEKEGSLIYCNEDKNVREIANSARKEIKKLPYGIIPNRIEKGKTIIEWEGKEYILKVFGEHNLMNIYGAMLACQEIGISNNDFLNAIQNFSGASKRLELVKENDNVAIYKDFAHSPSKLKATISALKNQFPDRELVAAMELHTFSSLTSEFLLQYKGAM
ncbi:MAG: Mur ligase family protein, partial [Bacteroidales bacterium]|nr:Mur ligase family protein [Bacteroidales bacterium]